MALKWGDRKESLFSTKGISSMGVVAEEVI